MVLGREDERCTEWCVLGHIKVCEGLELESENAGRAHRKYYDISNLAPVMITVYDRLKHLCDSIKSLEKNHLSKYTEVYVVSDGYRGIEDKEKVELVRKYLKDLKGKHKFKELTVIAWDENKGMNKSFSDAAVEVYEKYDRVISFEDDILVSNTFLDYMNNALEFYKEDKRIFSIASYMYDERLIPTGYKDDVFMYGLYQPWGSGIWKDRRDMIDYECTGGIEKLLKNKEEVSRFKDISPHAVRIIREMIKNKEVYGDAVCCYNMFKRNMYTIYPVKTLSVNRGFDGSGAHCYKEDKIQNKQLCLDFYPRMKRDIQPSAQIQKNLANHFYSFKYDTLAPFLDSLGVYKPARMIYRIMKCKSPLG